MLRTLIAAAVLTATAAYAEAPRQVQIAVRDLDLNRPADQSVLNARIHAAAVQVCGPVQYTADLRGSAMQEAESDKRACIAQVSERTSSQIAKSRMRAQTVAVN
jgi:UrcA family protein